LSLIVELAEEVPSSMVFESEGIDFELRPHINYIACNSHIQKSIRWGSRSINQWTLHAQVEQRGTGSYAVGEILEPDKKTHSLILYHLDLIIGLAEL
jgi:hypothetical protein